MTSVHVIRARHLATMALPLIDDGCVVVERGKVVSVGATRDIKPAHIDEDIDGVLMPGLINAHTHLELTHVARPAAPGKFQDWLIAIGAAAKESDATNAAGRRIDAVRDGVAQCLKFGVTCVGDIAQHADDVRPVLGASPIRAISYGECLGLGPRRERFRHLLERAIDPTHASERLRIGISPHAPYTVESDDFRRALQAGSEIGGFVTTHLAETQDEDSFLHGYRGAFGELYRRLRIDPGPGPRWRGGAIGNAWNLGLLGNGVLLAHMNYVTVAELQLVGRAQSRIVWCPRTHSYFGHPPHPWQKLVAAGATVCIGTDSAASSGDLNLVDDLRLVHRQSPEVPVQELWAMVTVQASLAMRGSSLSAMQPSGVLAAGHVADCVAFPTTSNSPLTEILQTPGMLPSAVWIGGKRQTM